MRFASGKMKCDIKGSATVNVRETRFTAEGGVIMCPSFYIDCFGKGCGMHNNVERMHFAFQHNYVSIRVILHGCNDHNEGDSSLYGRATGCGFVGSGSIPESRLIKVMQQKQHSTSLRIVPHHFAPLL